MGGCKLSNQTYFLAGGFTEDYKYSNEDFIYNAKDNTVVAKPNMFVERCDFAMAYIPPYVYVVGGKNGSVLKCCERFNLNTDLWEKIADMKHKRWKFTICVVNN